MDRGWGLALDSSNQIDLFSNTSGFGRSLSPRMDHRSKGSFSTFPAVMNSGGREELGAAASSPPRRMVLGEVDFFAEKKKAVSAIVKKESSHAESSDLDVNTGLQLVTANTRSDQSMVDDGMVSDLEDQKAKNELAKLQLELERTKAENQRLKGMLTQVSSNYSTLQMHLAAIAQQQQNSRFGEEKKQVINGEIVPRQFLDLAPGAAAAAEEQSNSSSEERTPSESRHMEFSRNKKIGREDSPESSGWASNKASKLISDQSASAKATMRKARVSVRARSEAPMISDGCQWRKYGQKMAKGNPCPRAYYRCTMAVGCPVRKQVQRCADDRSVLITTYEGTHTHPLPPAAMAMASTTSSAANMLLSGSMPSADGLMNPNFMSRSILPCSPHTATISASAPFPTVTLDLTTQPPNPLQSQRFPSQIQQNRIPAPNESSSIPQVFGQAVHNQSRLSGVKTSQAAQPPVIADNLSAAIAADPNFTAALAAAISSIIGGSRTNNSNQSTSDTNKTSSSSPGN